PIGKSSFKQSGVEKLMPRFYGPYGVKGRVGDVAYEIDLPEHSQIHNVFHVSCLKKALRQHNTPIELATLDEEGKLILVPEAIVDVRERKLRNWSIR
ncbi:hypothetical protein KI387_021369, partial [Taxus chinensis]